MHQWCLGGVAKCLSGMPHTCPDTFALSDYGSRAEKKHSCHDGHLPAQSPLLHLDNFYSIHAWDQAHAGVPIIVIAAESSVVKLGILQVSCNWKQLILHAFFCFLLIYANIYYEYNYCVVICIHTYWIDTACMIKDIIMVSSMRFASAKYTCTVSI